MFVTKIVPMCCAAMRESCQLRGRKIIFFIDHKMCRHLYTCAPTHTHE